MNLSYKNSETKFYMAEMGKSNVNFSSSDKICYKVDKLIIVEQLSKNWINALFEHHDIKYII